MKTLEEIQAALPQLSRIEMEQVRAWIKSRREIAAGNYTTRQPR
ncbi:MAG: hypothetical protein ACR2ID_10280 [Chthoniobacterales bacterium]